MSDTSGELSHWYGQQERHHKDVERIAELEATVADLADAICDKEAENKALREAAQGHIRTDNSAVIANLEAELQALREAVSTMARNSWYNNGTKCVNEWEFKTLVALLEDKDE